MRRSFSSISTSTSSSISGKTNTEANEVWRRALASKGEMRTRRCTPASQLQVAVGVRTLDGERRALDAGALAGLHIDDLRRVAAPLAPAQVLAEQHLRPVLRLGAAGPRLQRDDGVAGVVLAAQQALQVHVMERVLDAGEDLLRLARGLAVTLAGKLQIELRLVERFLLLAPGGQRHAQRRTLAQDALGGLAIAPEVGRRGHGIELLNPRLPFGEVKDTSRTPPGAPPVRRTGPSTR